MGLKFFFFLFFVLMGVFEKWEFKEDLSWVGKCGHRV